MVKLLAFLLLAVIVTGLLFFSLDLTGDPGYLLVAWRGTTLETSLVAAFAALVVLYLLFRLARWLIVVLNPRRLFRNRQRNRDGAQHHHETRTVEGLQLFVEQQWEKAFGTLERSFNDTDATVVNFLAAACAAAKLDREELWMGALDKAAKKFPGSLSAIRMLRAELLAQRDHLGQSLEVLEQLQRTSTGSGRQLALFRDIFLKTREWDRLEELLPALLKAQVTDEAEDRALQKQILLGRLTQQLDSPQAVPASESGSAEESGSDRSERLMNLWNKAPHGLREDVELISHYVDLLLIADAGPEAARVIEAALERRWDESLVEKYGGHDYGISSEQLLRGEAWVQEWPNDGQLLLALGRIAMRCRNWDRAREYFEASSTIAPTPEVFAELTRLLDSLGETEASRQCFDRYLQLADIALPELPMPDSPHAEQAETRDGNEDRPESEGDASSDLKN